MDPQYELLRGAVLGEQGRLHCAMFVLVANLCLAFCDADIEFDFVLMSSA